MNAPVLPESRKVNASVVNSITLTGRYSFVFNTEFIEAVQMNAREHVCLCHPTRPMTHFCCPGLSLSLSLYIYIYIYIYLLGPIRILQPLTRWVGAF